MKRRQFARLLTALALSGPSLGYGQKSKAQVALAFLGTEATAGHLLEALRIGMRENGVADGTVEYQVSYARGQPAVQERMIAELVARKPDVIVLASPPAIRAAMKVTRTVPVVMANVSDPVGNKFIHSLARPGGNVTGIATLYETVLPKMAEMLHALAPSAIRVAVLLNEDSPSAEAFWTAAQRGLGALGKSAIRFTASSEIQIVDAFRRMSALGVDGALVVGDGLLFTHRNRIASLARDQRIPAIYPLREHVVAGGTISYGPSLTANYRASARYVISILKGAKPAELPVEQPSRFELVVNRKELKALGMDIPSSLLLRADEVIE